jgi:hypothetical protein
MILETSTDFKPNLSTDYGKVEVVEVVEILSLFYEFLSLWSFLVFSIVFYTEFLWPFTLCTIGCIAKIFIYPILNLNKKIKGKDFGLVKSGYEIPGILT